MNDESQHVFEKYEYFPSLKKKNTYLFEKGKDFSWRTQTEFLKIGFKITQNFERIF